MILGYPWLYPLVMTNMAMEAMAIEKVDVVMFHSYVELPEGSLFHSY